MHAYTHTRNFWQLVRKKTPRSRAVCFARPGCDAFSDEGIGTRVQSTDDLVYEAGVHPKAMSSLRLRSGQPPLGTLRLVRWYACTDFFATLRKKYSPQADGGRCLDLFSHGVPSAFPWRERPPEQFPCCQPRSAAQFVRVAVMNLHRVCVITQLHGYTMKLQTLP